MPWRTSFGRDELSIPALTARVIEGRLRSSQVNTLVLKRYRTCSPDEPLTRLKAHLDPNGLPAALGCRVAPAAGSTSSPGSPAPPQGTIPGPDPWQEPAPSP